jgi:aryl-alcohol dehydrogenase-like predicted oxidoreductase
VVEEGPLGARLETRRTLAIVTEMTYRPLGDSGLMVSAVGIGCNAFSRRVDLDGVREILAAARDTGVTLLDTADVYGAPPGASESLLGEALAGQRDEFVVATKFGADMRGENGPDFGARASRRYVRRAVEGSLRRLRTDHIDLYQLHVPDGVTPIEETLSALTDLVREGKIGYLGCSNFDGWRIADADWTARSAGLERFVSVQNRYSLLDRTVEQEVAPACETFGLGLLPYFPLEYGLLTGKYRRREGAPDGSRAQLDPSRAQWLESADWDRIEAVVEYAEARGLAVLDVAIAGLAAQPAVASVISGATSGDQVRANAAALRWEPTEADLVELDEITG